jgi:hypothetical protein
MPGPKNGSPCPPGSAKKTFVTGVKSFFNFNENTIRGAKSQRALKNMTNVMFFYKNKTKKVFLSYNSNGRYAQKII